MTEPSYIADKLPEYEMICLGAALLHNELWDEMGLNVLSFSIPEHRTACNAIFLILSRGERADVMSVVHEMGSSAAPFVANLTSWGIGANWRHACAVVKEQTKLRAFRRLAMKIKDGIAEKKDSEELSQMIHEELRSIEEGETDTLRSVQDLVLPVVSQIEDRFKRSGELDGVTSGFPGLDRLTDGFQRGEVIVLAARTSMGKSELALSMIQRQCEKGIKIGLFACEMPAEQNVKKLLGKSAGIKYTILRDGFFTQTQWAAVTKAASTVYEWPLWIDDTPGIRLERLRAVARRMVQKGVQAIYIDHVGLIRSGGQKESRVERTADLSNDLQRLARELQIPIVEIVQLNRNAEGKRPTLADLRWSGDFEQDAATILFLHGDSRQETERVLFVSKARYGDMGDIPLVFLADRGRYEERV